MKWSIVELGNVAEVSSGDGAPQEASAFGKSGTPFIRAGSLSLLLNGTPEDELELIPESESARRRMRTYPPQTIVFAKSGMSCTKGLIYEIKNPAHVVNHLAALECSRDLDHRFLLRWFEIYSPSRLIANPSYPSIKISDIRSEKIPLPPLAEQKRIAAILDAADALRAKRREALAQLDALLQSSFLTLFGDPVTNPMGWAIELIGKQTTKLGSGSTPTGGSDAYKNEGISLIRSLNVHDGEFTFKNLALIDDKQAAKLSGVVVEKDDVLLNITGASVARVCRAPSSALPARVNQHVCIIRPRLTINPIFLEHLLLTPQTKRKLLRIGGAGATREAITKAQLEQFEVICPPLPLQQKFAAIVESIERQKTTQRAHLAELDALFAALQHRAFRGEL